MARLIPESLNSHEQIATFPLSWGNTSWECRMQQAVKESENAQVKYLKDENGNWKDKASIWQIICLNSCTRDIKFNELIINFFNRVDKGEFNFSLPEEDSIFYSTEYIYFGDEILIDSDCISIILSQLRRLIKIKCDWEYRNKKELKVKYDEILSRGSRAKVPFTYNYTKYFLDQIFPEIKKQIFKFEGAEEVEKITDIRTEKLEKTSFQGMINAYSEIEEMEFYLANSLHMSRNLFFHWLRLGLNKKEIYSIPNKSTIKYNGFWGDEWEGHPQSWSFKVDDSDGLTLPEAKKYYCDPHLWSEYKDFLSDKSLDAKSRYIGGLTWEDYEYDYTIKTGYSKVTKYLVNHFKHGRLIVKAFYTNDNSSKLKVVPAEQIEGWIVSKMINWDNNSLHDQSVYGFKVFRVSNKQEDSENDRWKEIAKLVNEKVATVNKNPQYINKSNRGGKTKGKVARNKVLEEVYNKLSNNLKLGAKFDSFKSSFYRQARENKININW